MNSPKKVVIVGAGFAGIYSALSVYKNCGSQVEITIINRTNYFLFTPMLHEVATGGLGHHQIVESIREIIYNKSINFLEATVSSVDVTKKEVVTDNGNVPYDILVVALGATTNFFGTIGASEHAFVLKNLKDALNIRDRMIDTFEMASRETDIAKRRQLLSFVVVGGGATGVEIVTEMAELCSETLAKYYKDNIHCDDVRISLINSGPELLSVFSPKTREYALKILEKDSIKVLLNTQVKEVTPTEVVLGDGTCIQTETVIWTAGVRPMSLSVVGGEFEKDKGDRIITNTMFQVPRFENIFAVGDVSHFDGATERGLLYCKVMCSART